MTMLALAVLVVLAAWAVLAMSSGAACTAPAVPMVASV